MNADRLIFWDIDGTLMHCGSDGKKALNRTFYELFGINDAFGKSVIGGAMDAMLLEGIMNSFGIDKSNLPDIITYYQKVLADILNNDNYKCVLPGIVSLLEAVDKHPKAINALLTSNLKIGAITKLKSVGLDKYFELGGFGDDPGEKWDAAIQCINLAEAKFNTVFKKDRIFLIGDSCYDIYCAKKLGIKSIAVGTGWSDAETLKSCKPDFFFTDLSDTAALMEVINI